MEWVFTCPKCGHHIKKINADDKWECVVCGWNEGGD